MNEIIFNKTSNIFLNAGIIGLYHYLDRYKKSNTCDYQVDFKLNKDNLIVKSDNLFKLLEDVYYLMGNDIYDTSTKSALEKIGNAYYSIIDKKFYRFPKMYTYGLGALITNNAAGKTRISENTKRIKMLKKNGDPDKFVELFENYFKDNDLELLQEIYFNEPYTKLTRLPKFDEDYFIKGNNICSLTGEKYKKLEDIECTSPFLSGLANFDSFGKSVSRKISWKAMYLSRFSPVLCLYMYIDSLDKLVCYFFNSYNLENLDWLYRQNSAFYKDKSELIECNYISNFNLINLYKDKKDDENKTNKSEEYILPSEILFMLIYTFYRRFFFNKNIQDINQIIDTIEPMEELEKIPISLIYFRADKFASTMRPNTFEYFNQFKFIIRLIVHLEKNQVNIGQVLAGFKILKESEKRLGFNQKKMVERKVRNEILGNILNLKSIVRQIEYIFYQSYMLMTSNNWVDYRNYTMLLKLTQLYEPVIKYGGNKCMNDQIQEKAINLGSSIGIGVLNYPGASKLENAKGARKYIISLSKTRTLQQFLDEIVRIQKKYGVVVSGDLLFGLKEDNWEYVKRFASISLLNIINSAISGKN